MLKSAKRILTSVLFFFLSFLLFFNTYLGFTKQSIDLSDYNKIESSILDKGIESGCFFVSLKGLNQKLGVYRYTKNYEDLSNNLELGDTIKVYYKPHKNKLDINIDLIQMEKGNQLMLDKKEYERKYSIVMYVTLIGGIMILFLSYLNYKRKI